MSSAAVLLRWQLRAAFRVLCFLAVSVGETMVALATAFKACRRASLTYGPMMIAPQLVLLLAWLPTRLLFLVLEAIARTMYRAQILLCDEATAIR
jgi:hypothetical protein